MNLYFLFCNKSIMNRALDFIGLKYSTLILIRILYVVLINHAQNLNQKRKMIKD